MQRQRKYTDPTLQQPACCTVLNKTRVRGIAAASPSAEVTGKTGNTQFVATPPQDDQVAAIASNMRWRSDAQFQKYPPGHTHTHTHTRGLHGDGISLASRPFPHALHEFPPSPVHFVIRLPTSFFPSPPVAVHVVFGHCPGALELYRHLYTAFDQRGRFQQDQNTVYYSTDTATRLTVLHIY